MLLNCPECQLQVSDKAIYCPHCGYPIDKAAKNKSPSKKRETHKRLPNGFGRITKINNKNLRKQYRVMVSVGKTADGKPIGKLLKPEAFFKTYNEAYAALVEYNKNPYDLDDDITVKELYERWSEQYFNNLNSASSKRTITSAWAYCSSVYNMRVKDLKAYHIKGCMNDGTIVKKGKRQNTSPNTKSRIKSLFNLMLDYANEHDLVDKNYARTFDLSGDIIKDLENTRVPHITFTDDEIQKLWNNLYKLPYVDVIIIQMYSGWRPQELGLIELDKVDLINWTFEGGMKTEAGTHRVIPIHSKIKDLVKFRYDEAKRLDSKYLFNCTDAATHRDNIKLTYDRYNYRFEKIVKLLDLDSAHRPHDPRKQFINMGKQAGINDFAIKKLVGHSVKDDTTEYYYTERNIEWLRQDIEKIP